MDLEVWSRQARPRRTDVVFLLDGAQVDCRREVLDDAGEPQTFDVRVAAANTVVVRLMDAYAANDGPGDVIAVSELSLGAR